jgi:hypothetical protein
VKHSAIKFLKRAKYPANPKDLFAVADSNKTDDNTLGMISSLPDVDFESDNDVAEVLKMVEEGAKFRPTNRVKEHIEKGEKGKRNVEKPPTKNGMTSFNQRQS